MKKAIAAVLMACMLMLTACSSAKETAANKNFETKAASTTTEATETTETEAQTEATKAEKLIPLFNTGREADLRQKSPEELFTFTNFAYFFFPLSEDGRTFSTDKYILYNLSYGKVFSISPDPVFGEGYEKRDVEICFFEHSEPGAKSTLTGLYYKLNDTESSIDFVPFYYNPAKGCLVGYYKNTKGGEIRFVLSEMYYAPDNNRLSPSSVNDTSEYDEYFKAS